MERRRLKVTMVIAGLSLLVAACSGGESASSEDVDSERQLSIGMGDFFFEPVAIDVSAGDTVRFLVANGGDIDHEFRVTNAELIAEHLEEDHGDEDHEEGEETEAGEGEAGEGHFIVLEPGQSGVLEVTFTDDETAFTEIACLLPGHYEAGMKGLIQYGT